MGSTNNASNAAAATQASAQQAQDQVVNRVNTLYDSPARQQTYSDYLNSLRTYLNGNVNTQAANSARQLKFSEARGGLSGGSAAAYAGGVQQKDYSDALLQAERQAQAGESSLMGADASQRASLISMAANGMSVGEASRQAAQSMQASLGTAQNNLNASSLGTLFGNTADIYKSQQDAAAKREEAKAAGSSLYGNSSW